MSDPNCAVVRIAGFEFDVPMYRGNFTSVEFHTPTVS